MFGQVARKPSRFLATNFRTLRHPAHQHPTRCRCDGCHVHLALTGVDDDGRSRTAPAKQYPP
eukprot:11610633-Karenia_brevis.AAC.1